VHEISSISINITTKMQVMHNKFYDLINFAMLCSRHSTKCGKLVFDCGFICRTLKESVEYAINFVANFVSCHEVRCVYLICKTVIIPTYKAYEQWQ
jgi:hypothetical protein